MCDIEAVRNAIFKFRKEHIKHPFDHLREVAVQAELKRLVDHHLQAAKVDAVVVTEPESANFPPYAVRTDRVRLEAKVILPGPAEAANITRHDRTDLILYRNSELQLFRHKSGPGDVVYKTLPAHVLAAVEIKASPSHQLQQKKAYARDIRRLVRLSQDHNVAAFFVLLDKSSPLYEDGWEERIDLRTIAWTSEGFNGLEAKCLTDIVYEQHAANPVENWDDIYVSVNPPANTRGCVEIVIASERNDCTFKLFAFIAQGKSVSANR